MYSGRRDDEANNDKIVFHHEQGSTAEAHESHIEHNVGENCNNMRTHYSEAGPRNTVYSGREIDTQHRHTSHTPEHAYAARAKRYRTALNWTIMGLVVVLLVAIAAIAVVVKQNGVKSEYQKLSQSYLDLENRVGQMQSENDKLKQDYDDLKKSNDKLKEDYEILKKAKARRNNGGSSGSNGLEGKTVYLTFDDGPSPVTPKILATLDKYNVKATFFVINSECNSYLKDIQAKGHTIGLHSYSHTYKTVYASPDAFMKDLNAIDKVVYDQVGIHTNITRFPGGGSNTISANYCKGIMSTLTKSLTEKGYHYFDWNADSGDASGNNVAASKLVANVKRDLSYSGYSEYVVLMHDAAAKSTTADALPEIIEWVLSKGGKFAAIDENTPEVHHGVNN